MINALPTFTLVLIFGVFSYLGVHALNNYEEKLLAHLLKNHSSKARPVLNMDTSLSIQVGLELVKILNVVEVDNQITTKIWLRSSWTNELMKWNPNDWGNVNFTSISPKLVWTPDLVIYEELAEDMSETTTRYEADVDVYSDGNHSWQIPVISTTSCKIKVEDFPFDYQTCKIKLTSWTYDMTKLNITDDGIPIITDQYIDSTEWILEHASSQRNTKKYECCVNNFTDVTFTFNLKRKPLYYIITAICPCIIMIFVILFSFFLPSDAKERINLIVTLIVMFVVFLQLICEILPRNSDSVSALSIFYLCLMWETTFALIATSVVVFLYLNGSKKGVEPLPELVRNTILQISKTTSIMYKELQEIYEESLQINNLKFRSGSELETSLKAENLQDSKPKPYQIHPGNSSSTSYLQQKHVADRDQIIKEDIDFQWQLLATILDRVFFVVLLLTYAITVGVFFA